jgi:hypothetical protein
VHRKKGMTKRRWGKRKKMSKHEKKEKKVQDEKK